MMKPEYCPDYVGVACVDGTCPIANQEEYALRCAEHNQGVAEEQLAQQAENVKDWVPVVHCKDCKYAAKAKWNKKGYRICPASYMEITDDDFCSYGVVK